MNTDIILYLVPLLVPFGTEVTTAVLITLIPPPLPDDLIEAAAARDLLNEISGSDSSSSLAELSSPSLQEQNYEVKQLKWS